MLQTGTELMAIYCERLSQQLLHTAEQFALGTLEMEALTASVSTVMESRTRNTEGVMKILLDGLKASGMTTPEEKLTDALLMSAALAQSAVKHAAVIRKPGRPTRVRVRYGRTEHPERP